jgi:hypothetical protein
VLADALLLKIAHHAVPAHGVETSSVSYSARSGIGRS